MMRSEILLPTVTVTSLPGRTAGGWPLSPTATIPYRIPMIRMEFALVKR